MQVVKPKFELATDARSQHECDTQAEIARKHHFEHCVRSTSVLCNTFQPLSRVEWIRELAGGKGQLLLPRRSSDHRPRERFQVNQSMDYKMY